MAKNRSRNYQLRLNSRAPDIDLDRDSGVQLDDASSPVSRHFNEDLNVGTLSNPLHSVTAKTDKSEHTDAHAAAGKYSTKSSPTQSASSPKMSPIGKGDGGKSRVVSDRTMGVEDLHIHSGNGHSEDSGKEQGKDRLMENIDMNNHEFNYQDVNVTVTLNLDEDEGVGIKDICVSSDIAGNPQSVIGDSSPDNSENDVEKDSSKRDKRGKEKDSKKRRFRKIIGRPLRRSHSAGCGKDLQVPEDALFMQYGDKEDNQHQVVQTDQIAKSTIHKTYSADATMMAGEVFPLDGSDLSKVKPAKSSIAKNMKRKLKALRRRNTDSALGAAIMHIRGLPKITQADTAEWAKSFESLLSDKNGLELFRDFLKSEFSEENIEFWIACEEFKTIRTNKLVSQAHSIYSDYVAVKSPRQVNLDSNTRLETVTSLECPTREMFKAAQKRIQFLMENDSYVRFLSSDVFLRLAKSDGNEETR